MAALKNLKNDRLLQMAQVIRHLSQGIGGRGSCTENERLAGEYLADLLRRMEVQEVRLEGFKAVPSTYWPYGLAFALALAGSLASLLFGAPGALALAAIFNALGFVGMLAETELAASWMHWFLPRLPSQNVIGVIPPVGEARRTALVCAHLDTHRTPIFFSSKKWNRLFSLLIALSLVSMAVGTVAFGLGAALDWASARWFSLALVPVQTFALLMCLQADFTPYSPGANDNASGVAVAVGLAHQLVNHPLSNTEVYLLLTGCEEVGDWGMRAFLDDHADRLGPDAFYMVIDQVGVGAIRYLTADGLFLKRRTHPHALQVARQVAGQRPELGADEMTGIAYTDALKATQRGLPALTLCAIPDNHAGPEMHWHQMSDTANQIVLADLDRTFEFACEVLHLIDRSGAQ